MKKNRLKGLYKTLKTAEARQWSCLEGMHKKTRTREDEEHKKQEQSLNNGLSGLNLKPLPPNKPKI